MMQSSKHVSEQVKSSDIAFLLFLSLLNVINFIDRQLLVSFSNWIKPELNLSNFEFGLLAGLVFIFFYAVMGLFMGAIADRVNRTRLIAFGLGLWSILTVFSGAAKGFLSLAIPRMFIGVGESTLTPAALSLLGDRFPAKWQGLVVSVYGMGVSIGLGLSLFIVAYLEPIFGWRGCFYLLGSIGVVMAIGMFFIKETPRKQPIDGRSSLSELSFKKVYRDLKIIISSSPSLTATLLGSVIFTLALGAASFEQLWFVEERGFDRHDIARKTAGIAISAGIIGNLVGGYGGDIFLRWSGMGRPYFLALVMLLLAPFIITYRFIEPDNIFFWIGVFATYFQVGCLYGPAFGTIQDLVPSHKRGIVVGFTVLLIQICGAALGASGAGYMIDVLIGNGVLEPYSLTLLTFSIISLMSVPIFVFAGKRFESDKQSLEIFRFEG
tara:strand:+ start:5810 stop:7120 length:1311 start_codon:yes stop_codon:yes gene_type:complete